MAIPLSLLKDIIRHTKKDESGYNERQYFYFYIKVGIEIYEPYSMY